MKLINNICVFLSLVSLSLPSLEAKSLEFFLDHTTQKIFTLQATFPEHTQQFSAESSRSSFYCQQLKIENVGEHPIKNCFPYVNQALRISLDDLASQLAHEKYPLLALYHLWTQSVKQDATVVKTTCHPLDLLNFKGVCSPEVYSEQFIKLCNALGFKIRLAQIHGKSIFDFYLNDEWNLLDLSNQQFYLGWNNEKLISSEEIMDDPLLALRTKHSRHATQIDFKESWKQLAHFEILDPTSAMPIFMSSEDLKARSKGLDLYPSEILVFGTSTQHPELIPHEHFIRQTLNLESRQVPLQWTYQSPFPIQKLANHSSVSLLIDQKTNLLPGEYVIFKEENVFQMSIAFSDEPKGEIVLSGLCAQTLFPSLIKGKNQLHLGTEENPSVVRFYFEIEESLETSSIPPLQILNDQNIFDYCSPTFVLKDPAEEMDKVWWQISPDNHFQLIPPNFDQVEDFTSILTLPLISETFLNPSETYYFRVKGCCKGQWSEWSVPYAFVVNKPIAVEEVEFNSIDEKDYELNWERCAEDSNTLIEYWIFGSNALDFIPSIYCEKQINALVNGEVTDEEINDNLINIVTEPKIKVSGNLAYYRIVARQKGQFSVPSTLIHIYDQDLIQPRNILQVVEDHQEQNLVKRTLFPASYPWNETALPYVNAPLGGTKGLIELKKLLSTVTAFGKDKSSYEFPIVAEEIWEEVKPYLLPPNHPAWAKLNRIFCKARVTQNSETFKKAGFKRWRPGRWSRVSASSHFELQDYFIKAYCDCEIGILYDWKKWIHRIKGAECIRECIKKYKLQENFKVPHKWIYPLPKHPSPPNTSHYVRKNFILVCENMNIQDHSKNEKMYKHHMTTQLMDGLYTILQVCGLYDSVYCFNMPFCKDNRIAIIDTEYHHKWPVPFMKLSGKFSSKLRSYWEKLTYKGGKIPSGISEHNPPRMDRRDTPVK